MELEEVTLESVKKMIFNNYNTYFSLRTLKKDFWKVKPKSRDISDNDRKELGSLGRRLGKILLKLTLEGIIERYNENTFKIVRDNFTSITQK